MVRWLALFLCQLALPTSATSSLTNEAKDGKVSISVNARQMAIENASQGDEETQSSMREREKVASLLEARAKSGHEAEEEDNADSNDLDDAVEEKQGKKK